MLYALLMLGLLPAAFLFEGSKDEDGESEDDFEAAPEPDPDFGALPEEDIDDDAEAPGETLSVPATAGDMQISGFRPGLDKVDLAVSGDGCSFYTTQDSETGDGILHIEESGDERLVWFLGLDSVPIDDITVCVTDPIGGAISEFALSATANGGLTKVANGAEAPVPGKDAISRSDPEAEDLPNPAADRDGPSIGPSDPESGDSPTGGDQGDTPLDPIDTLAEDLLSARGGSVDDLLARDSDSFGSAGVATVAPHDGTSGDDMIEAPATTA